MVEQTLYSPERTSPENTQCEIPLNPSQKALLSLFEKPDVFIPIGIDAYTLEALGWSQEQMKGVARSLFGIIATSDGSDNHRKLVSGKFVRTHYYGSGYYVPQANWEHLQSALAADGTFRKDVEEKDLPVLEYIYTRSMELANMRGSYGNPRFHPTEISRQVGISKDKAKGTMNNLLGVLAQTSTTQLIEPKDFEFRTVNSPRWFLPRARLKDAELLVTRERGSRE